MTGLCEQYMRIKQRVQAHKSVDKDLLTIIDGHWLMKTRESYFDSMTKKGLETEMQEDKAGKQRERGGKKKRHVRDEESR